MTIDVKAYSALIDRIAVIVPAPAIIGNAKGTTDALASVASSSLNNFTPRIISKARNSMINEPATEKDLMSKPRNLKIVSPKNRKAIIIPKETSVANSGFTPVFCLMFRIKGIDPVISITANNTIKADPISCKSIVSFFWCD